MPRAKHRKVLTYIAAHVRRLRLAQDLTQEVLAEKTGLELRYLQKVERAQVNMGATVVAVLADALGVGPGELFQPTKPLPAPQRGRPRAARPERARTRKETAQGTRR
jgi:transcriptional regulator with XRE-family HTH domain